MKRKRDYNRFLVSFLPGLLLPLLFALAYVARFFPHDMPAYEVLWRLFPGVVLGKIMLLSIMPNLLAVFVFYKMDKFKLGIGMMVAALPYLLMAVLML